MEDVSFFARYGETSRIVGFFSEPADAIAARIFDLYRRHAAAVCRVFDEATASSAAALRQATLPSTCLISLVVGPRQGVTPYPSPERVPEPVTAIRTEIRIAIDEKNDRVLFDQWGDIRGVGARLIIALAEPFRKALQDELAPEHYPFLKKSALMRKTGCDADDTFRRRLHVAAPGLNDWPGRRGMSLHPLQR